MDQEIGEYPYFVMEKINGEIAKAITCLLKSNVNSPVVLDSSVAGKAQTFRSCRARLKEALQAERLEKPKQSFGSGYYLSSEPIPLLMNYG